MTKLDQTEYTTWVDFTERMQGTVVSQYDWELFYNRYMGFIHDRCVKKGWLDLEQEIMDRCVLKFNDEEIKKIRHDRPGSFRAWLYSVIEKTYYDIFRERNKMKNKIIQDAESIDDENFPESDEQYLVAQEPIQTPRNYWGIDPEKNKYINNNWDEEKLWQIYVAYIVFDLIKKNTSWKQFQVFVWRDCKNRPVEEIAQATGFTKKQVYEYSRAVKDKLKNQFKKFGEMPQDLSSDDWDSLSQNAKDGYEHYRKIADEVSTRYTGKK